jgi:16S rRNA (cytosine1402-N4)-methyltransferase
MQEKMHQNKHQNKNTKHEPVLLREVIHYLDPQSGENYLDLTAGYGGHAEAILARTGNFNDSVLVDRDKHAITDLQQVFGDTGIEIRWQDFLGVSRELISENRQFDLILGDLGVSSPHLNEGMRGFAINEQAPLDMRMDQRQPRTAADIVNSYSESVLADVLTKYGEEPKAKQIAQAIVRSRPVNTTTELAAIAAKAWPGYSRIHPATRTFQAIRIEVNDELKQLELSLPILIEMLKPGGRIALISFHSLEDRIVKRAFAELSGDRYDAELHLLTKNPATAAPTERAHNPRARSAKLRAAVKIKTKKGNAHANSG